MNRRLLGTVPFVILPLAALALYPAGVLGPEAPLRDPVFAELGDPTMPFVPVAEFIGSTWHCAGVPSGNDPADGQGGDIRIVNPTDGPLAAFVTVFTDAASTGAAETATDEPVEQSIEVGPRSTETVRLTGLGTGRYVSAMVEIGGGGGWVEQRAVHSSGESVSPCGNSTSANWYFADNYTRNGSQEDLVITNPFPHDAIIDVALATNSGQRVPQDLQGIPVPARSIAIVTEERLPKDEAVLGIAIRSSQGRVVGGRMQHYTGERFGYSAMLGAPSLSTSWWFPDGDVADDVHFERYSIYNPSDTDVSVSANFWGITDQEFTGQWVETIPAGEVRSFLAGDFVDLPQGRHGMVFTTDGSAGIVVEQGITRKSGDTWHTSVAMGAPRNFEGFTRWSMAYGSAVVAKEFLIVMNLDFEPGLVTVKALGPTGEVAVPGLEAVELPGAGVVAIPLPDDPAVLDAALVVESGRRIVVQRSLPRGLGLRGRSSALALPG